MLWLLEARKITRLYHQVRGRDAEDDVVVREHDALGVALRKRGGGSRGDGDTHRSAAGTARPAHRRATRVDESARVARRLEGEAARQGRRSGGGRRGAVVAEGEEAGPVVHPRQSGGRGGQSPLRERRRREVRRWLAAMPPPIHPRLRQDDGAQVRQARANREDLGELRSVVDHNSAWSSGGGMNHALRALRPEISPLKPASQWSST